MLCFSVCGSYQGFTSGYPPFLLCGCVLLWYLKHPVFAFQFACEHTHTHTQFGCLLCLVTEGDYLCMCSSISSPRACISAACISACWIGQMVQLYGAETTGPRSSGQMGRDGFVAEMAEWSVFCLSSFSLIHYHSVSVVLSICLSPFLSLVLSISPSNSYNWSWQCFSDWAAWVNGKLPASLMSCVCLDWR